MTKMLSGGAVPPFKTQGTTVVEPKRTPPGTKAPINRVVLLEKQRVRPWEEYHQGTLEFDEETKALIRMYNNARDLLNS